MAEFYWQPSFGTGGPRRDSAEWDAPLTRRNKEQKEEKEPSQIEKTLLDLQKKAEDMIQGALELAKTGDQNALEEIDERLRLYKAMASASNKVDEERIADVRKQYEFHSRLKPIEEKYQKEKDQLKKDIFG